MKRPTQEEYISALEKMKRSPRDRIGLLGQLGVTGLGVSVGYVAAGTIAGAAGASTLLGSGSLASLLSGLFVTTTPVGWIVGSAVAGGALAYGCGKLIRSGGIADAYKSRNIEDLEKRVRGLEKEAQVVPDHEEKVERLITGLQHLVASGRVSQDQATGFLGAVEKQSITVEQAFEQVQEYLQI